MKSESRTQVESAYMSPADAARTLGVSPQTVRRWAAAGKIAAIRPGGHFRYLRADVEALAS